MKQKNVVASICYPDNPEKHAKCFTDLFRHYERTECSAGDAVVTIAVDGDEFIIKVMKGFDCLTFSLKDIKEILKET